ncbi:hypothetical protein GGI43DRAFT_223554 [Trichoderma evansii]
MPKRSIIQHKRVSKKLPLDGDPDPRPMQNSQFPRFEQLPPETRLQIWRAAICQATVDRTIHVEVHPQIGITAHNCFCSTGVFCGQHGDCTTFREGLPHWSISCMLDGYFASTDLVSSPGDSESSAALASISLACRESRMMVLELFPKVLRVYHGPWHPGAESRLVRCRPETDVLVIYAVPDMSITHTHYPSLLTAEHWAALTESKMKKFPCHRRQFAEFKEVVSCFQNVAIFSRLCGGGEMFPQGSQESDANEVPGNDLFNSGDMRPLLLFFSSLKQLYFWIDPVCYPNAWDDAIRVTNVENLKDDEEPDVEHMQINCQSFIQMYNERVEVEKNHHVAADNRHWIPQPKLLERVGCFCPASWLR